MACLFPEEKNLEITFKIMHIPLGLPLIEICSFEAVRYIFNFKALPGDIQFYGLFIQRYEDN